MQGVSKRWQVTERDVAWLAWIGRWRGATSVQVSAEFAGRGESAPKTVVDRRLRGLKEIGLAEMHRMVHDLPSAWSLTREGMNVAGVAGRVLKPRLADFRHDHEVIMIARQVAVDKPSHQLVTEREIRRLETPDGGVLKDPKYSVRMMGTGRSLRWLYPDLVSVSPEGQTWAHELEASRKDSRRLVRLMMAYIYADHITGVRYYAVPQVEATVKAAAAEANAAAAEIGRPRKIFVQPWRDISPRPATSTSLGRALPPEDAYSE
ncbi:hypothetical protein ACQPXM_41465 (plasmid) [Kribbella sp. CA-253562]|uniref:hypothetical protein n=1 Tax=Kribbella sp. CA-253562 TaxID=3239942 RepID=UPI003D94917E